MNISQQFKNHFIGSMPAKLAAQDMLDEVVFPHVLPYEDASIAKCFRVYIDNCVVDKYRSYCFQTPMLDKTIHMKMVELCDEFVFHPVFFHQHVIQDDAWDNGAVVEGLVEDFTFNFHAESQHALIDHFNTCIRDEAWKGYAFSKCPLSIHQGTQDLASQYRAFLRAMEYECIAEILEAEDLMIPGYNRHEFAEYMKNLMLVAHEDLDYPVAKD